MPKQTIYIAPGNTQCRVYAIPYAMRPGQSPRDIAHQHQAAWAEIGLLNHELKLVCLNPAYADLCDDIAGQMGGSFFEVERATTAPPLAALRPTAVATL